MFNQQVENIHIKLKLSRLNFVELFPTTFLQPQVLSLFTY